MRKSKIKVGILGLGTIAQKNHIPVWKKIGVGIIGIDKNVELCKYVEQKYGILKTYTSLENALNDENIDIIDNCTPVQLHFTLSLSALERGVHTLVEKPMATRYCDAQKMVKVANENKVKLGVIHNTLFNPFYLATKGILSNLKNKDKEFEITRVNIEYIKRKDDPWILDKNHWSHQLELGMITEILAHPLYILDDLLDKQLQVKMAVGKKLYTSLRYPYIKYDEFFALLEDKSKGSVGTITITLNSIREDVLLTVYTTDGIIYASLWRGIIYVKGKMRENIKEFMKDNLSEAISFLKSNFNIISIKLKGKARSGHSYIIPDFYEAVVNNRQPQISGEDGLRIVKLMDDITKFI